MYIWKFSTLYSVQLKLCSLVALTVCIHECAVAALRLRARPPEKPMHYTLCIAYLIHTAHCSTLNTQHSKHCTLHTVDLLYGLGPGRLIEA